VIYTDTWPDESDPGTAVELSRYQVTATHLDGAPSEALFLPCPPVHRGKEVSEDAMQHPNVGWWKRKTSSFTPRMHSSSISLAGAEAGED
jgi:ornithine carbamoyltransferase